jgi:hypothetical protein
MHTGPLPEQCLSNTVADRSAVASVSVGQAGVGEGYCEGRQSRTFNCTLRRLL